jgi:hypothetical protein
MDHGRVSGAKSAIRGVTCAERQRYRDHQAVLSHPITDTLPGRLPAMSCAGCSFGSRVGGRIYPAAPGCRIASFEDPRHDLSRLQQA